MGKPTNKTGDFIKFTLPASGKPVFLLAGGIESVYAPKHSDGASGEESRVYISGVPYAVLGTPEEVIAKIAEHRTHR